MPRTRFEEVGAGGVGAVTQAQGIARDTFKVCVRPCLDESPPSLGVGKCGWHREDHRPTAVVRFVFWSPVGRRRSSGQGAGSSWADHPRQGRGVVVLALLARAARRTPSTPLLTLFRQSGPGGHR